MEGLSDSMIAQMAVNSVKAEYEALGMDIESVQTRYLLDKGGRMLGLSVLMMAVSILAGLLSARISAKIGSDLRSSLFRQVVSFSDAEMDRFSTASLITRSTNDIQQVQQVMMMFLRLALRAPGMLIGALIMAFMINSRLALVILVVVPVLALAIAAIMATAYPRFGVMQAKLDKMNSGIQEALVNVRVIKSFVRGEFEEEKFARANEDLKQAGLNAFKVVIFNMPIMMLAMYVTTLAVVWSGGRQVLFGTMPVGDLTAFTTYIVQVLMSLMMLAMVLLQSSRAVAGLKRITEVLDTEIDLSDDGASGKDALVTHGAIEFRNVSFSYYNKESVQTVKGGEDSSASAQQVLSNLSFRIEAGETVGIIGATGCGKTSLVQFSSSISSLFIR